MTRLNCEARPLELHDPGVLGEHTQTMTGELDRWVSRLEAAAVTTADSSLRRDGTVPPVTVHVLSERFDPPYVGFVFCREFEPGGDAAVAVAAMGVLPGVLAADRVVVCWEHVELAAALQVPGAHALQPGLVVVDAYATGHEVRLHPIRLRPGPDGDADNPVVEPEWGPVSQFVGGHLPEPVVRLLQVWRQQRTWSDAEAVRALASLESAGYSLHWIRRHEPAIEARRR